MQERLMGKESGGGSLLERLAARVADSVLERLGMSQGAHVPAPANNSDADSGLEVAHAEITRRVQQAPRRQAAKESIPEFNPYSAEIRTGNRGRQAGLRIQEREPEQKARRPTAQTNGSAPLSEGQTHRSPGEQTPKRAGQQHQERQYSSWVTDVRQATVRARPLSAKGVQNNNDSRWQSANSSGLQAAQLRRAVQDERHHSSRSASLMRTGSLSLNPSRARISEQPGSGGQAPPGFAESKFAMSAPGLVSKQLPSGRSANSSESVGAAGRTGKAANAIGDEDLDHELLLLSRREEWLRWAKRCTAEELVAAGDDESPLRATGTGSSVWPGGATAPLAQPVDQLSRKSSRRGPW